ncbi:hypothetical protein [Candidatus Ruminimicrobium bovinum]|uniref:hypothetical protein n=1 Tax=Candidatus Ruminimicrobium bovinum TaxID=3242779 RepID=UPI0039B8B47F
MNKKIILLLTSIFIFSSVYISADVLKVVSAFAVFFSYGITHSPISNVSSMDKNFNAKISVDFGSYVSADAKINYYLNGDTSNILHSETKQIENNEDFYISLSDLDGSSVSYQIEVDFKDSEGNKIISYWPSDSSSYQTSTVTDFSSGTISAGKSLIFENGNQSIENTSINFSSGAYAGLKDVMIKELDKNIVPSSNKPVKLYVISVDGQYNFPLEEVSVLKLSYPELSSADKVVLRTGFDLADLNKELPFTLDNDGKLVTANINNIGYFAIFINETFNDSDYRPERRVIVKARAGGETGFWFKHLTDGDSVKIYDVTGKKIAEITSGTDKGFVWYGKNNSGQWVESGTYIYQIKVKGKSKLISGTIAFVK